MRGFLFSGSPTRPLLLLDPAAILHSLPHGRLRDGSDAARSLHSVRDVLVLYPQRILVKLRVPPILTSPNH